MNTFFCQRLHRNDGQKYGIEFLQIPVFRIRVVSQKDYQDKFLENYQKFSESRGMFSYYGYIPESPSSPLAITWTDLQDMFSLL